MKATVQRSDLLRALQLVMKAVNPKPAIPLFSNTLLECDKNGIRLSATDFEIGIRVSMEAESTGKFITAVPAKLFTELVSTLQADTISLAFNTDNDSLAVTAKGSKNNMRCVQATDFPAIPIVEKAMIKVDCIAFKKAVSRVSFCAKPDDKEQSILMGVLLRIEKGKLIMFAVDGFHLSYEEIPVSKKYGKANGISAVIKANTLDIVSKMLDEDGEVSIEITDKHVRFNSENIAVVTQVVYGNFPDHKKLIASVNDKGVTSITVDTLQMLNACDLVHLFADNGKSELSTKKATVELSAVTAEKGDGKSSVKCVIAGKPITLSISVILLRQFLAVSETEQVVIDTISDSKPILLRMEDVDTFKHIIMPIAR